MADSNQEHDRELPATPKQRQKFAEQGDFARSRELMMACVLLASFTVLLTRGAGNVTALTQLLDAALRGIDQPLDFTLFVSARRTYLSVVLPLLLCILVVAVAGQFLQQLGKLTFVAPKLRLERLDPFSGLQRIFGPKNIALSVLLNLIKITLLGSVFYWTLKGAVLRLVAQTPASIGSGLADGGTVLWRIGVCGLLAFFMIGLLDYARAWFQMERRMRMSSQQIRDEHKESSGDPAVRARRRKKHQELARARSLKDVHRADVILVNPTHVAVAILYQSKKMPAPRVVAKGADAMAEQIRRLGRTHGVPIVSQPPLARLLYAKVKVGACIPEDMYKAVAVVLAHVYRLKKRS